ncbi:MAG: peroxiredoxin [Thermodesulfobacteriota bacterium]
MQPGDKLPAKLSLPDQTGAPKSFGDLSLGQGLVIFVYARDNTSGCGAEAGEFQAKLADFVKLGYGVAGLSRDSAKSHAGFAQKLGLGYSLLSDPDLDLIKLLGAWGVKKMYGKESEGVVRSSYVFDAAGRLVKAYPKVKAQGHAAQVLADLAGSGA